MLTDINNKPFKPFDLVEDTTTKPTIIGIVVVRDGKLFVDEGGYIDDIYPLEHWNKEFKVIGHFYPENYFEEKNVKPPFFERIFKHPKEPKILINLTDNRKIILNTSSVEFADKVIVYNNKDKKILELEPDVFVGVRKYKKEVDENGYFDFF